MMAVRFNLDKGIGTVRTRMSFDLGEETEGT